MSDFVLVIGNKNFSSWSMRAWLALKQTGAAFDEHQIWIEEDRDRSQRRAQSPAGRVPVLRHGDARIWDTLAIAEYLAELFPDQGLWPGDRAARARARSICAEMHSGFFAIRTEMPMNCRARKAAADRGPEVALEVARVVEIWEDTRREFGGDGRFLFGEPSLAEAFFAPVVSRFATYSVPLEGAAAAYRDDVLALPAVCEWLSGAAAEEHTIPEYADRP